VHSLGKLDETREPTNDDVAVSSFNLNLDLVNNNDGNLAGPHL
jgi:hypothetical protein